MNEVHRIGVRNGFFGTIHERRNYSYSKSNCNANKIYNECLFEGRGWPSFKAKYDELMRMLNSPCESCGLFTNEMRKHVCEEPILPTKVK